jgi:hypothetical protein
VARFDKYDGMTGGYRAPLDFDISSDDVGEIFAVGLNASGRVVLGAGNTGITAVICATQPMAAGDIIDNMTAGEIVECAGLTAGTTYFGVNADGTVATAAPATGVNATRVGQTVEATRLVVRVGRVQG